MIEGDSMYFGEDAGKHCVAMSLSVWFQKIPIPSPRRVFSQFDPPPRRIFRSRGLHGIPLPPRISIIFPLAPPPLPLGNSVSTKKKQDFTHVF